MHVVFLFLSLKTLSLLNTSLIKDFKQTYSTFAPEGDIVFTVGYSTQTWALLQRKTFSLRAICYTNILRRVVRTRSVRVSAHKTWRNVRSMENIFQWVNLLNGIHWLFYTHIHRDTYDKNYLHSVSISRAAHTILGSIILWH